MYAYQTSNELRHYGVLGMKWGVRRSQRQLKQASKLRKKGKTSEANELESKARKNLKKHESRTSKATVERVSSMSTGKAVGQSLLMGTYGALKYNEVRSMGAGRGNAAVAGVLANAANIGTGGILGIVEPRTQERGYTNTAAYYMEATKAVSAGKSRASQTSASIKERNRKLRQQYS